MLGRATEAKSSELNSCLGKKITCLKRYYFHKGKIFWVAHWPGSRAVSCVCKWFPGSENTPRIPAYLWSWFWFLCLFSFPPISSFFPFLPFPKYLPGHRYRITPSFCVPCNPASQTVVWIQGPALSLPCPHLLGAAPHCWRLCTFLPTGPQHHWAPIPFPHTLAIHPVIIFTYPGTHSGTHWRPPHIFGV